MATSKQKNNWISGAIQHPGSLRATAAAAKMSIAQYCAQPNISSTSKRRCALARTLKSFKK